MKKIFSAFAKEETWMILLLLFFSKLFVYLFAFALENIVAWIILLALASVAIVFAYIYIQKNTSTPWMLLWWTLILQTVFGGILVGLGFAIIQDWDALIFLCGEIYFEGLILLFALGNSILLLRRRRKEKR